MGAGRRKKRKERKAYFAAFFSECLICWKASISLTSGPNAIIMWMLVGPLVKDMDAFQQIKHSEKNAAK